MSVRGVLNRCFTASAWGSILILSATLVIILGPIFYKGVRAVFFRSTVEFRELQHEMFSRGGAAELQRERTQTENARKPVYDMLDRFSRGIDPKSRIKLIRSLYRQIKHQISNRVDDNSITPDQADWISSQSGKFRDSLIDAYETVDRDEALKNLDAILVFQNDGRFSGGLCGEYFELAEEYRQIVSTIDLSRREKYASGFAEVKDIVTKILGPAPGSPTQPLAQFRYGMTRWDRTRLELDRLLWAAEWVPSENGKELVKVKTRRELLFRGTSLQPLFEYFENNIDEMMNPRFTFYWQYLIDDSTPGHFFGGVGPETLGTVFLTVLAIAAAVPLGVAAGAYLAGRQGGNVLISAIRICINTLAGVPSIVFGLFGLAFFLLTFQPALGLSSGASILAGGLTLAVLVLPVVIRSSEEAIRSVPGPYVSASLALGASKAKTFFLVTLPAALPGILTGVILSMGRAAGETAPILFVAAVALGPVPKSIMDPTRTLSYGSYDLAVSDRLAMEVPHNQYGMVSVLVLVVLVLNLAAIILRARVAKKLSGR